jgi:hypothetical protein
MLAVELAAIAIREESLLGLWRRWERIIHGAEPSLAQLVLCVKKS